MNSLPSAFWSRPLSGLDAVVVAGYVQPPVTTRAARAAADEAARSGMSASMDPCEQARQEMQQAGIMRAATPEMVDNMKQCQASERPGIKPTGFHL